MRKFKMLILLSLIVIAILPINALSENKECTSTPKKCAKIKGGVKGFVPPNSGAVVAGARNSTKSNKKVKDKGKKLQRVFQISNRPEVMATLKKEKPSPPTHKSKPQTRQAESTSDNK